MISKIKKQHLGYLFVELKKTYRIIGPKIEKDVIVYSEINSDDIPVGYTDSQTAGSYRLIKSDKTEFFAFSSGFDSFKRYLNPPYKEIFSYQASKKKFTVQPLPKNGISLAFFGVRSCDMVALELYDRIFLGGIIREPQYELLRHNLFIVAINCTYPGDNCFCISTKTGPEIKDGYDLLITELEDFLLLESGSQAGMKIMETLPLMAVNNTDIVEKASRMNRCKEMFKRSINLNDLPFLIYKNLEHSLWQSIADRDLECGNCTQVCPTCFCTSSYDSLELKGISKKFSTISGKKLRKWDSCFSRNFARVHGGNFRTSRKARYRHWFAHKLAYCLEQFGLPGCVGCGRCITWCPAGIDITQVLEDLGSVR